MHIGVLGSYKKIAKYVLFLGVLTVFSIAIFSADTHAGAGINQQLNFQGRLYTSEGATAPDGYYNIEFKIYQDGDGQSVGNTTGTPAGSLEWTEDYLNADGHGVMIKNGFMSVQLGSVTPFGSSVDWNQDTLWLSMNIAGTGVACTPFTSCSPDGEMIPMKRLSSTPFSLNSGLLNGKTSAQFLQLAQGVQTDASTNTPSIYVNKTGTGNLISLQSNSTDVFTLTNSGDITFGNNADHAISVTTANADTVGRALAMSAGSAGTGGAALAGGSLTLQGGNGGGTNGNGGNIVIDGGIANGTGTDGTISIGSSHASTIQIGSSALAAGTQTINIGNNNTAGGTTNIVIGTGATATGGTTTLQAKGNLTFNTDGLTRGTFDTANGLYLGNSLTGAVNPFTVRTTSGSAGVAGSALTIKSGDGGSSSTGGAANFQGGNGGSTSGAGGAVAIQGGNATAGNSNGGDTTINAGLKFGTGVDGNLSIGNLNTNTVQIGNTALAAGTQTINIGTNNTAGGTTNVTIGNSSTATAGTTTLQAKGTIVYRTNGTTRMTLQASNTLTLGPGTTGAATTFTINASNGAAATNAGSAITVQGGTGNTTGLGGAIITQGGTGGATAAGGAVTVAGGTGGSTSGAGGVLTIKGGAGSTAAAGGTGGALIIQGGVATGTGSFNGGDLSINAGLKSGTGTGVDGSLSIGNLNTNTIQIGNNTLAAGIQAINVGTNNTAGGTTNITIGSGSTAAGTTTVRSRDNLSLNSSNGNVSATADAGTMTISGYTATALSSTTSSLSLTGNTDATMTSTTGNTHINSTAGYVDINSKTNTTITTNGSTRATFDSTGNNLFLGSGQTGAVNPFTIMSTSGNAAAVAGSNLSVAAGQGGSTSAGGILALQAGAGGSTSGAGGALNVQGGNATAGVSNGGDVNINSGNKSTTGIDGNINIGNLNNGTVQIGNNTGTQTINIGTASTGTANVTVGSASGAAGGTTTIQGKTAVNATSSGTMTLSGNNATSLSSVAATLSLTGYTDASLNSTTGNTTINSTAGTVGINSSTNTTIGTNGTVRATFDTANNLYLGNGVTAAAPNNFSIRGTGSTTTAVAGGTVTVQGGNATVGNANGGNLTLSGGTGFGTGVNGIVVINTPTFSTTANDANCYTGGGLVAVDCTFAITSVNNSAAILAGFSATGKTAILPDPTLLTAGRVVYITAANASQDFTLSVNGGGTGNTIAMRQNTTATMIWNGTDWTAAGASSSTTLQSAYDNTMQSAGGAELIVSHTGTTNGLTIRDSSISPVNGTLLTVQTSSAAGLLSVNSNVTEYASDAGAETAGASASTFPASTWSNNVGSTVSRYTTAGNYIATGQASVSVATSTSALSGAKNTLSSALTANMSYNVSFATRLTSGTFTDLDVYYSVDGTAVSVACTTGKAVATSVWTKVNCMFVTPASGITAGNAILIRQTGSGTARTFYVDNLSVTICADFSYATDGGVYDSANFATNWSFVNATTGAGSVTRNTSDGYDASDSASVTITTGATNAGIRNKLSTRPLTSTLYRITTYAKLGAGTFTDFKIRYSRDGSTGSTGNYVDCVDYNTQTLVTTDWTKITCYVTTDSTAATNPYVNFVEGSAATRTFAIDAFSMSLNSSVTPNVQIGGGINGGPVTLFTLDRGSSAPIASDNDALLGSMYYDTSLGKLQCYEADGWGACGSSPDNVVTISPEFTNAVMHGTGVGTMTSDICSSTLAINDGSSSQPTICGSNETYNFYKWTSPQASAQTYSIYVTYQLPSTFKSFASGDTSVMGRTDSANSTVQYQIYRNDSSTGLTACGSAITVSTGVQSSWQVQAATGAADPSTCGFAAGNSIVFKINVTASLNANAYVGNLNFIFSNR